MRDDFVATANEIYTDLVRNTAFPADGLWFQKWANTVFFMQVLC